MLGHDLVAALGDRAVTALTRAQLDITDPQQVEAAVLGHDVVINAAAWTRVDDAETSEDAALAVNGTGAGLIAAAAARAGARLVQVSTDYVFDGRATVPYAEYSPVGPVSAYGRTKAEGERLALEGNPDATWIIRTAWLYGESGPSFPRAILRAAKTREVLDVVDDQRGQPTWSRDLAELIVRVTEEGIPFGVYHGTARGETSRYHFAREILASVGLDPDRVQPSTTTAAPGIAQRPSYSVLGHDAWAAVGFAPIRDWRDAWREVAALGILEGS